MKIIVRLSQRQQCEITLDAQQVKAIRADAAQHKEPLAVHLASLSLVSIEEITNS